MKRTILAVAVLALACGGPERPEMPVTCSGDASGKEVCHDADGVEVCSQVVSRECCTMPSGTRSCTASGVWVFCPALAVDVPAQDKGACPF